MPLIAAQNPSNVSEAAESVRPSPAVPADAEPIRRFFGYAHLPPAMQEVSKRFADLADFVLTLPRNPERSVALRKLLEAKDAAVRAALPVLAVFVLGLFGCGGLPPADARPVGVAVRVVKSWPASPAAGGQVKCWAALESDRGPFSHPLRVPVADCPFPVGLRGTAELLEGAGYFEVLWLSFEPR